MQAKCVTLFMVIIVLVISTLTGCPPQVPPPGDSLIAREFWDIMMPFGETLGDDVVSLVSFYPLAL